MPKDTAHTDRRLEMLESLLAISSADLKDALSLAMDLVASALRADKVDAFLYDERRDTLFAVGTSHQPLSGLQRKHGLDALAVANGGRIVGVFRNGETFFTGKLEDDTEELRGIRETLQVRSAIAVPLEVGGTRRGVLAVASRQPDFWDADDVRFAEALTRWVGTLAHRAELVAEIERSAVALGRRAAAEELVTVLAHDLRSYLAPVDLRTHFLTRRAEAEGRSEDVRDLELVKRGLSRVTMLISDILDVARIDKGILTIDLQPVPLDGLLRDLATTLSTPAHPVVVTPGEDTVVLGDLARLRQCLQNLIANAIKYSPRGAPVTVTLSRETHEGGERAKIEIVDQGPGIAGHVLPHVFERFVSDDSKRGGLGIGLFLAKAIATMHGGTLEVSSSPAGARFQLTIPCCT
jgi:two-component system, OmpR family, sensor kinase